MRVELRRRDLGELIGIAFELAAEHFGALFLVLLVCSIPPFVVQLAFLPDMNQVQDPLSVIGPVYGTLGVVVLIQQLLLPISEGTCCFIASQSFTGERLSLGQCLRRAFRRYFGLLLLTVSAGMITGVVTLAGTCCLFIPGIVAAAWFHVLTPALLLEDRPWMEAFERGVALIKGYFWEVLAYWVTLKLVVPMVVASVAMVIELTLSQYFYAKSILQILVQTAVMTVASIAPVVMYYHLRVTKEAYDVQVLAQLVEEIPARQAAG